MTDDKRMQSVAYRSRVAQLVLLARQDLAQDAPHDLPGPRLGQIRHHEDGLGRGKRSNRLAHLHDQILLCLIRVVVAVLERHKGIDRLPRELIVDAHDCGFSHAVWG
jgi:hypothetical protein